MGPKIRKLIIFYHLTSVIGIVISGGLALYCLVSFLSQNPEDALGTVQGILKDARAHYTKSQPSNKLEFRFEKIDQAFVAQGINSANMQFFMAREAPGSELTATVTKSHLGNPDIDSVEVHELKSKKTVYLKLNSRLKDQQRWQSFAGIALVIALGLMGFLFFRVFKKIKVTDADAPLAYKELDPILILLADSTRWIPLKIVKMIPILPVVLEAKAAHEAAMPARPQTQKPTHMKALQMLVESGRIDARDGTGRTPLHIASSMGQTEVVDALLKLFANVDNTDNDGNTPIMAAIKGKHMGVVIKLLDMHPNLDIKNLENKSALDLATELQQEAIGQLIKRAQTAYQREALLK